MSSTRVNAPAAAARPSDPYKWPAWGLAFVVLATPVVLLLLVSAARPRLAPSPFAEVADRLGVHPGAIELGMGTYMDSCAVCHGRDARGIPRLGKPLRNSEFVQTHSDSDIYEVILTGRPPSDPLNTTGAAMPARAGNPALGERRLHNVVYYLRTLQDPTQPHASLEGWQIASADADGSSGQAGGAAAGIGHAEFIASCSACHGPSGEGIEGLGKALAESPFVASRTDKELMTFIKTGRPIWDPENTTGIDMPPKGGNPALSEEDLRKIVEYIRALHPEG